MEKLQINLVNEEEINLLDRRDILLWHDNAQSFALIEINRRVYGLSWRSTEILPKIEFLDKLGLYIIGIDQVVVAFSMLNEGLLFKIGLNSFFQYFINTNDGFVIIAETEIIQINGIDGSINRIIDVPDIITNCIIENGKFIIDTLTSGRIIK